MPTQPVERLPRDLVLFAAAVAVAALGLGAGAVWIVAGPYEFAADGPLWLASFGVVALAAGLGALQVGRRLLRRVDAAVRVAGRIAPDQAAPPPAAGPDSAGPDCAAPVVAPATPPTVEEQQAALRVAADNRRREDLTATLDLGLALVRDPDGTIRFWSDGCERRFGWTAEEAIGRAVQDLLRTVYPIPLPEIEATLEREGEWVGELEHQTRSGETVIVTVHKVLRRDAEGRAVAVLESVTDVTGRRQAEARQTGSDERLRSIVETAVDAILVADSDGKVVSANPAALKMFGYVNAQELIGCDLGVLMPMDEAARHGGHLAAHRRGSAGGAAARAIGVPGRELMAVRRDGSEFPIELSVASFTSDGQPFFTGVVRDVTERKRAEGHRMLLAREVDHRAKNALAVALSLLRLTPRDDASRFAASVEGRVAAMARAHSLLATEGWAGADLRTLIEGELMAHAGHVSMAGPPVQLAPEAVQPVAMLLQELATNALKYGALKLTDAQVVLSWHIHEADGSLHMRWQELGGPPVPAPPSNHGFGSRLIEALVEQQLHGAVRFDWPETGMICSVSIARRFAARVTPAHPQHERDKAVATKMNERLQAVVDQAKARPRVLVVEDDALLGMELEATLIELGCEVVGPAGTLAEAVRLAANEPGLSAAVLDVNLGNGEYSFPAVDLLETRGVPYIFATGYGSLASLEGHDQHAVAVLVKPYSRDAMSGALAVALRRVRAAPRAG